MSDVFESLEGEVKRGVMQVAVMCLLEKERYGYDLVRQLKEGGLSVEEGTLYPILKRLEDGGLLTCRWDTAGPRPRKYFLITGAGKAVRGRLLASLKAISAAMEGFENEIEGASENV